MVSPSVRFRILQRDNFRCRYCGASSADAPLEIDHEWPRARGGRDKLDNLVTACKPCNQGKSDRPLATTLPDLTDDEMRAEQDRLADLLTYWHHGNIVWLITVWKELTGLPEMSRRDEVRLEALLIRQGMQTVERAMRVSAAHHEYESDEARRLATDEDDWPVGRVDLGETEQIIERWKREAAAQHD